MPDWTNTYETKILNHFLGLTTQSVDAGGLYVGLFTAFASPESAFGTEVSDGWYARRSITFGTASNGSIASTNSQSWTNTGSDRAITHVALLNHATNTTAATVVAVKALAKTIAAAEAYTFDVGAVTFGED